MSETLKPILVVEPNTLNRAAVKRIESEGYIVVQAADPTKVQILRHVVVPKANIDLMFGAALKVLNLHESRRTDFGKAVLEILAAAASKEVAP